MNLQTVITLAVAALCSFGLITGIHVCGKPDQACVLALNATVDVRADGKKYQVVVAGYGLQKHDVVNAVLQ